LKHSSQRLWAAITNPEEVSKWMSYPARIDLRVGGDWYVDFSRTSERDLDGVIVRIQPERNLAYVWGRSVLEWTIEQDGEGCRYTFSDHGNPTLEGGAGIAAGWHAWIDALEAHLDGARMRAEEERANWDRLQQPYRERLDAVLKGTRGAQA
jgi:uncharacterized protein YndB with AHSA1/START domain